MMPKKGENIYKRKDGRWEGRCRQNDIWIGEADRLKSVYGKTYTEVKQKMQAQQALCDNQKSRPKMQGGFDFALCCDEWIAGKKPMLKESTYQRYYETLETHIKPWFAGIRCQKINAELTAQFGNALLQKGLANGTVKNILSVLHMVLNELMQCGRMPDFLTQTELPKEHKQSARVLSMTEYHVLAKYLLRDLNRVKLGILLSLECGLRIGEICALRTGDVSLKRQMLYVRATLQRLPCGEAANNAKTRVLTSTPKSASSMRSIPLTKALGRYCAKWMSSRETDYLLTGDEKPMEPRMLRYHLEHICEICGLQEVHFHTLRHTFATRCIDAGVELKALSEILGHSTTRITMDCYVHPSVETKRTNLEKLKISVY
ncbi:MAG: tyrosine-type recombinase/integrase [Ruthenibacterium sp.]